MLSEEVLNNIEAGLSKGQSPVDFGLDSSTSVKEEVDFAWSRVRLDWKHFIEKTHNLPANDPYGTTLSRKWMEYFLSTLGYQLTRQKATLEGNNNQTYSISHAEESLDKLPVHIVGFLEPDNPGKNTLDIRTSGGTTRMSAHATVQEYLNVTEHLYGIVTNGFTLRLIRDSGRLIRLNYIEIDLKRLLDEDKFNEFNIIYRLLHVTRLPKAATAGESSLIEDYYQQSLASGNRIRDELSKAVKISLHSLANGFLKHSANDRLREEIQAGQITPFEYNHSLLRLIYRLLFLMVTEERDLLFAEDSDTVSKYRKIYNQFYSIGRLRKLSAIRHLSETQYSDLWQGLLYTFKLVEPRGNGPKLGISPLGGDLFSEDALGYLNESQLSNQVLLDCIRSLNEFEDKVNKSKVFVNYRALDVEELGSIYEGLLELEPEINQTSHGLEFNYTKGTGRSSSGSHYTPEDLVKPLIKHSLEYLIEDRVTPFYKGKETKESTIIKLLDLKICDVACGSGHILLSAARRLAMEVARIESGEQQPNPTSFRMALRKVIQQCIYGVDKNPLAVELCKVSLWLEAHVPGSPLNFLDHHIKCGDAIVGLAHREELENGIADEAFKTLPGDDKDISAAFRKRNQQERKLKTGTLNFETEISEEVSAVIEKFNLFKNLPENTPAEVAKKEKEYRKFENTVERIRLKQLADVQVAQFFIPKTEQTKDYLITDSEYRAFLKNVNIGMGPIQSQKLAYAEKMHMQNRFFHWFLEFPEVFQNGGFDCILGNPPFLGGTKISTILGGALLNYLYSSFEKIGGRADLVTYFFRRDFQIIKLNGFQSLISTNTISQGDTREGGLEYIINRNGVISHAVRSIKWPGLAAVEVSLITIFKGFYIGDVILNNIKVEIISSYLSNTLNDQNPNQLFQNTNKAFEGYYLLGDGFIINRQVAIELIDKNNSNTNILFPYFNGQELYSSSDLIPSKYAINFDERTEEESRKYIECFKILELQVKPEREKKDRTLYPKMVNTWWQYWRTRQKMKKALETKKLMVVQVIVSKTHAPIMLPKNTICSNSLVVFSLDEFQFPFIACSFHDVWAWKYSSTMKTDRSYSIINAFETFPFPQNFTSANEQQLESIGSSYHEHRRQLMLDIQLGLTKTYNLFHDPIVKIGMLNQRDEKKGSKNLESLIKHLAKTPRTISLEEAIEGIEKLRTLHVEMDLAVLEAYGWAFDTAQSPAIKLRHDFYEVDYLPENDRVRFTIHPDVRKEVLKRLLELNHRIHEEEVAAGLWDKKKSGGMKSKKENKVEEPKGQYGLFGEEGK